ncbi:MAG: enoyl-CoA hydratase/isomerase family protein [Bacteroidales bacterium]|nr:enoyl-CoA hydratase/isomerase family protein [Bacteroidales bacterium]
MEQGNLYTFTENHIATVEFYHPAGNSLPSDLLNRLIKSFNELNDDNDVKVIVLKSGKDRTFCSGASLDELLSIDNPTDGIAFFSGFGKLVNAMRKCKKPIIGRVQGKAVGGGVGIISACDYVMATEQASIKLSEISIGIGPFVVEPAIRRKIGIAAVSELSLNPAMWQNAYWAKDKGLYARVFDNIKDLDKEIQILSEQLASYSPEAVQHLKRVLWEGTEEWDTLLSERANICGNLVLSETTKKALQKFKK